MPHPYASRRWSFLEYERVSFSTRKSRLGRSPRRNRWRLIVIPHFQTSKRRPSSIHRPIYFRRSSPETVPSEQTVGVTPSFIPSSVLQVRSSISLANVQTVPFLLLPARATLAALNYYIQETPTVIGTKPSEGTATGEELQVTESGDQLISTSVSTTPAPGATASLRGCHRARFYGQISLFILC